MPQNTMETARLGYEEHPENRTDPGANRAVTSGDERLRPGFPRYLAGMWIAGTVGSLLTLMTVAYPLGAGDTVAAFSMLPLAVMLIAVVNGWIAANLFWGSTPPK